MIVANEMQAMFQTLNINNKAVTEKDDMCGFGTCALACVKEFLGAGLNHG